MLLALTLGESLVPLSGLGLWGDRVLWGLVIAAPFVMGGLWWGGVLKPGGLGKGRSEKAHSAGIWLACAAILWCFALFLTMAAMGLPESILGPDGSLRRQSTLMLATYVGGVLAGLVILIALGSGKKAPDLMPRPADTGKGVLALVIVLPMVALTMVAASWVAQQVGGRPPDVLAHDTLRVLVTGLREGELWAWVLAAMAVLGAPLLEEIIYRALLQTGLVRLTARPWLSVLIASAVFTLVHVSSVQPHALAVLLVLSLGMGAAYERTGSLMVPITMHVLFNAGNIALAMAVA